MITEDWHHFPLSWVKLPMSQNVDIHYYVRAKLRREIHKEVITRCQQAKIRRLPDQRWHVVLHWQPRDNGRRDTDNAAPTLKAVVDGLVAAGVFVDDNSTRISSETKIHTSTSRRNVFWVSIAQVMDDEQSKE